MNARQRIGLLAAALWWGSLSTIGALVVPMLFAHLGSPAAAGAMAGKLFSAQTWVSTGCAVLVLMAARSHMERGGASAVQADLMLASLGLLLALLIEFAVAPRIVAREDLRLWHGVGTAMFAAQWVCALALLWRAAQREPA